MNHDYIFASIGGLFIGAATLVMLFFLGRIAGISGIIKQAFFCSDGAFSSSNGWRWLFLIGIPLGALVAHEIIGVPRPERVFENYFLIALSGLLVGVGVSVGSGCTSGHGICGLSRISLRSLVATLSFMGAGVVTVFVTRHLL